MASVYVDVPGIGTVEAKNAASEATLQAILKVMTSVQKNTAGKGAGGGGAGGSDGGGGGKSVNALNAAAHNAGVGFKKLTGTLKTVAGVVVGFGEATTGVIQSFANVGDSVENAASVFKSIPLVGTMFSAVATAATKVTDSFQAATASGATFGGSIQQFAGSASAAGLTMDKFAQLISKNGEALRLLGGDTATGAKRFAAISKTLRTSSNELYNLGYSTEDVNQGMANYTKYLGSTGKLGNQTNAQLASGAKNYLKEMDLLAKVTGESRKDQEDARAKLLNDAQFQGKVANMGAKAGEAFANTVNMLPPGLRDVAKDIMVTGTATTEESQKFMSMMPKSAALMQKYAAITDAGGTITAEMQNELNNMLAAEGKSAKQQYASIGKYNKDMAGVYMNTVQASNIQNDAMKNGTKEQKAAAEKQATLAAAMEKNKQALAELSNTFQMALANSGILDLMMKAFQFLANITQTYLIPAFNILANIVTGIGGFLLENLKPVFEWLTGFIKDTLYPAFLTLAGFIVADIVPIFESMGSIIKEYIWPALTLLGGAVYDYVIAPFMTLAGFVWDNLTPVLMALGALLLGIHGSYLIQQGLELAKNAALLVGTAAQWIVNGGLFAAAGALMAFVAPILAVVIPLVALVALFKALYDSGWTFGNAIDAVKDNLSRFWLTLVDAVNGLLSIIPNALGGISEEEALRRKKANDDERERLDAARDARDAERAKIAHERDSDTKQQKRNDASAKIDQKIMGLKTSHATGLADANKKELDARAAKTDMNTTDSVALLGQELKSQKSGILPKAEAAKKEIEQKGVAKQADDAKTKADAEAKVKAEQEAKSVASPAKTQESAESLLASLNTKMEQLLAVGRGQLEVNRSQLSAAHAMSGDLHKMA
jgi:hypothetical protein